MHMLWVLHTYYFYICKSVFWSNSKFKGNIFVNVVVLKI